MNDYVIGIDIGSSKVCAVAGKVDKFRKLQIIGITSVSCSGMKKGVVVDIDSTCDSIKKCIQQLEGMVDISITNAYISLSGGICELIFNKGVVAISSDNKEIGISDVERVLKASKIITIPSDKEIIGVIPQQYIVDGYDNIKDPVGMSGLRLEVEAQIILAPTTVVNNIFKSINKAGIKVNGVVFEPLAVSQVVLHKEEMETGIITLDIGADISDISIFKDGKLCYTDAILLGGNNITNDIMVCLKLSFTQAEKLKLKYASVEKNSEEDLIIKVNTNYNNVVEVEYKMLIEIIEARVEEILQLIYKKLKNSGHYNGISGIVIVGGGLSLIKGLEGLSEKIFNKPVRIGSPEFVGAASPIYVPSVGIVQDVVNTLKFNKIDEKIEENTDELEWIREKKDNSNNNGIVSKIKEFFTEFF